LWKCGERSTIRSDLTALWDISRQRLKQFFHLNWVWLYETESGTKIGGRSGINGLLVLPFGVGEFLGHTIPLLLLLGCWSVLVAFERADRFDKLA